MPSSSLISKTNTRITKIIVRTSENTEWWLFSWFNSDLNYHNIFSVGQVETFSAQGCHLLHTQKVFACWWFHLTKKINTNGHEVGSRGGRVMDETAVYTVRHSTLSLPSYILTTTNIYRTVEYSIAKVSTTLICPLSCEKIFHSNYSGI